MADSLARDTLAGERNLNITILEFSLVVLIGASGSGKSTFAREHFTRDELMDVEVGPPSQMAVFEAEDK